MTHPKPPAPPPFVAVGAGAGSDLRMTDLTWQCDLHATVNFGDCPMCDDEQCDDEQLIPSALANVRAYLAARDANPMRTATPDWDYLDGAECALTLDDLRAVVAMVEAAS